MKQIGQLAREWLAERQRDEAPEYFEPHDAHCLCGQEGHEHSCDCDECRRYPYHGRDR